MILLSGLENERLWNMIKTDRLKYIIDNMATHTSGWCFAVDDNDHVLVRENSFMILEELINSLKNDRDLYKNHDFSTEQLKPATEMFIYLNLCPKFMFDWVKLYVDLLQNGSPDVIVQTLNRILITARTRNDKTIREITKKIFRKFSNTFELKFLTVEKTYEIITDDENNLQETSDMTSPNREGTYDSLNTLSLLSLSEFNSKFLKETLQTKSYHPIHIYDKEGKVSPSAFIPFCAVGRSKSAVGQIMDAYELPLCNKFEAKIQSGQLCYEIDLDKYKNKNNLADDLKSGFVFLMDYNEDRQVTLQEDDEIIENDLFVDKIDASLDDAKASIYLNTIGDISDIHNS